MNVQNQRTNAKYKKKKKDAKEISSKGMNLALNWKHFGTHINILPYLRIKKKNCHLVMLQRYGTVPVRTENAPLEEKIISATHK